MSSWDRRLAEKLFVSCSTLKVGAGRFDETSEASEIFPSFYPAGT